MRFLPVLLAFALLFVLVPYASAASWSVCSGGCNYTSIQSAIGGASNGDTIIVGNGTYTEDLSIIGFNGLTVKSASGKDVTTIQLVDGVGINIDSDNVIIGVSGKGFTIKSGAATTFLVQLANNPTSVAIIANTLNSSGSATMGVSVGTAGATRLVISDNEFFANDGDGSIWCPLGDMVAITDNAFYAEGTIASGYAIQFSGLVDSTVTENYIDRYAQGIALFHGEGVHNVNITDNWVVNATAAFRFGEYKATGGADGNLYDVDFINNIIIQSATGIRIHPDGAHVLVPNVTVTGNTFLLGFTKFVNNQHSTGVLSALDNYWAAAIPDASKFSANVSYYPFCVDVICTKSIDTQLAEFDGASTTDFSAITDWSNVSLVLDNDDVTMAWDDNVNLTGSSLLFGDSIAFSTRSAYVDTSTMPEINFPAVITFHNSGFTKRSQFLVYRDGLVCPDSICYLVEFSGGDVTLGVTTLSDYHLVGSGINEVLSEAGSGLGNFINSITDPMVSLILGLGMIAGVLAILLSFAALFSRSGKQLQVGS